MSTCFFPRLCVALTDELVLLAELLPESAPERAEFESAAAVAKARSSSFSVIIMSR